MDLPSDCVRTIVTSTDRRMVSSNCGLKRNVGPYSSEPPAALPFRCNYYTQKPKNQTLSVVVVTVISFHSFTQNQYISSLQPNNNRKTNERQTLRPSCK